jgi:hypothetical protein
MIFSKDFDWRRLGAVEIAKGSLPECKVPQYIFSLVSMSIGVMVFSEMSISMTIRA